jgi:predicted ATPase
LVCIEEPELGLHPDILPTIADLLIEASSRMQLVVTTQSDILVDALTEIPEAILVCEKCVGSTTMKRLKKGDLESWLEKYALGDLWRMGEIGGKRW